MRVITTPTAINTYKNHAVRTLLQNEDDKTNSELDDLESKDLLSCKRPMPLSVYFISMLPAGGASSVRRYSEEGGGGEGGGGGGEEGGGGGDGGGGEGGGGGGDVDEDELSYITTI